jgi:hypothetical protein
MDNIKVIKLQNGCDLVSNVSYGTTGHYTLEEPMEFSLEGRGNETGLVMRHWLPVQLLRKNAIDIKVSDVLAVLDPADDFSEYYLNTVSKIKELLKAKEAVDNMTDEEMNDIINDFELMDHKGNSVLH